MMQQDKSLIKMVYDAIYKNHRITATITRFGGLCVLIRSSDGTLDEWQGDNILTARERIDRKLDKSSEPTYVVMARGLYLSSTPFITEDCIGDDDWSASKADAARFSYAAAEICARAFDGLIERD